VCRVSRSGERAASLAVIQHGRKAVYALRSRSRVVAAATVLHHAALRNPARRRAAIPDDVQENTPLKSIAPTRPTTISPPRQATAPQKRIRHFRERSAYLRPGRARSRPGRYCQSGPEHCNFQDICIPLYIRWPRHRPAATRADRGEGETRRGEPSGRVTTRESVPTYSLK
jgi:hypothetical protein